MGKRLISACASVALAVGTFVALTADAPPVAADTSNVTVPLTCQTSGIPIVGSQTSTKDQGTITVAPASVFQNDVFTISIGAPPETESSDLGSGATLNNIHDLHVYLPVPANVTVQSFNFTPGFGYGASTATPAPSA